jgi:hypothetical protein
MLRRKKIIGLASCLYVECHYCGRPNIISTSDKHHTGKHGPLTYDINSRVALGALHVGIGQTHVKDFLTTINVPPLNNVTFKKRMGSWECY